MPGCANVVLLGSCRARDHQGPPTVLGGPSGPLPVVLRRPCGPGMDLSPVKVKKAP